MRLALAALLVFGTAAAQQQPVGLAQFLGLTATQTAAVQQSNAAFTQFSNEKYARLSAVQAELATESAKASPDPQALGQRYIEIDSINREMAAAKAAVQVQVRALLTPAQTALLQQISAALVQASLLQDARCGGLVDVGPVPTFAFRSGDFRPTAVPSLGGLASFLLGVPAEPFCPAQYPISISTYLALTDSQVSGILNQQAAYASLKAVKDERTADVEAEIRDETSKPSPDALALGVRYAELAAISQQLTQADKDARAAARSLLTTAQQAKLQSLLDASALTLYEFTAETCNFLSPPPQAAYSVYIPYGGGGCSLN